MPVSTICPVCSKTFLVKPYILAGVGKTQISMPCCSTKCAHSLTPMPTTRTHGHSRTKEYRAWLGMKHRCLLTGDKRYDNYGGRGIKICKRWLHSFENFLEDMGHAPSKKHSLGRIDNDGDYEPGNVEWQLPDSQANNKSTSRFVTVFGRTQTVAQWAKELGINGYVISLRLKRGWSPEESVSSANSNDVRPRGTSITFCGKSMNLVAWSRETGIAYPTLVNRIRSGWSIEEALTIEAKTHIGRKAKMKRG